MNKPQDSSAYDQAGFFVPGFNAEEYEDGGKASPEPDDQLPFRKKRINTTLQQGRHSIPLRGSATPQPDVRRTAGRSAMTPQLGKTSSQRAGSDGRYRESEQKGVNLAWELHVSPASQMPVTSIRPEDLVRPLHPEDILTFTIRMDKGVFTTRYLFSLAGGSPLLIAKKRMGRTPANYLIAGSADFRTVLAKLKSNFTGSQFLLYVPKRSNAGTRNEIAIVLYSIGEKPDGYRKLSVYIPDISLYSHSFDLLDRFKSASLAGLHLFTTHPPAYFPGISHSETHSYSFNPALAGAMKWSFKNFHLGQGGEGSFAVQMVKTTPCTYQLAVCAPFSPLQAVGIALSSIDHKILCD